VPLFFLEIQSLRRRFRREKEMKGKEEFFPEMIRSLTEADIKLLGVKAHVLQGSDHQVMFFECAPGGEIPADTHGAQFGVVLDGQFELTVGGETRIYRKGDTYYMHPMRFIQQNLHTNCMPLIILLILIGIGSRRNRDKSRASSLSFL